MLNEKLKEGATRLPARRWLLLLLLGAGLLFLIFGSLFPQDKDESERLDVEEYKASLTQEVTALCERVDGAGEVALVIHFKGTEEYVYATDNNKSGKEYVYTSGSGLLLRVDYPAVDGVSVLCEGGSDAAVRREMTDLLSSLLGIGANRIHIGKGNFGNAS